MTFVAEIARYDWLSARVIRAGHLGAALSRIDACEYLKLAYNINATVTANGNIRVNGSMLIPVFVNFKGWVWLVEDLDDVGGA